MRKRWTPFCLVLAAVSVLAAGGATAQVVPGFVVSKYADVTDPIEMTFAPSGVLYTGRDHSGSGGTTYEAVKIHRIGVGGFPVTEYGLEPIPDPDAVLFDAVGWIADTPGSVLVGGMIDFPPTKSRISAIRPDGTIQDVFGALTGIPNPNSLKFDSTGRLLVFEDLGGVWTSTGGAPSYLFSFPVPSAVALDSTNNFYAAGEDGVIRIYDSLGTLIDGSWVTGLPADFTGIEFGPGGIWGTDLYGVNRKSGDLYRIDSGGTVTVIGTGFDPTTYDVHFGPDGALYTVNFAGDQIIRIIPEPHSLLLLGLSGLALIRQRS